MSEPICPMCGGSGKNDVVFILEGKRFDKCSMCDGAGIATDDEAAEFIEYLDKEE
jgi:DnaJ-class molecular chaperone